MQNLVIHFPPCILTVLIVFSLLGHIFDSLTLILHSQETFRKKNMSSSANYQDKSRIPINLVALAVHKKYLLKKHTQHLAEKNSRR